MAHNLRLFFVLFALLFGENIMFAQQQTYSKERLKEDLKVLYDAILTIHPNPYTGLDSSSYAHLYDSLSSIIEDMSRTAFLLHIAPLITSTDDGHLNISFGKKRFLGGRFGRKKRQSQTMNMPLAIRQVEDNYLIAGNLSLDTVNFVRGTKVLSIEGVAMGKLVEQIGQFSGGSDGPSLAGRAYWTLRYLSSRYRHFYGEKDSLVLEIQSPKDSISKEVKVASLSVLDLNQIAAKRYGGKSTPPIGFQMLNDTIALGRINVRTFSHPKDIYSWKFSRKLKKSFKAVKEAGVETLIIDVRGNGGGALNNAALVARYLLEKPFRLGKEVSVNRAVHKNRQVKFTNRFNLWLRFKYRKGRYRSRKNAIQVFKPKKKYGFRGEVYLLTDAGSFSATANLAAKLKSEKRVTIIGEATGGGYYMDFGGFFQYIKLPNTKVRFRLPLIQYINNVDPTENEATEILPHVEVRRTYEDFLKKEDTVIKHIEQKIKLD